MQIVILIGHLGADPEMRHSNSGVAFASVSLATSEKWTDKTTGELREETEWHRLSFIGRQAEVAQEYLHKGDMLIVRGKLKTRKWQDKEGIDRYTTEIVVQQMKMAGGKGRPSDDSAPAAPRQSRPAAQPAPAPKARTQPQTVPAGEQDFDDDDIPF